MAGLFETSSILPKVNIWPLDQTSHHCESWYHRDESNKFGICVLYDWSGCCGFQVQTGKIALCLWTCKILFQPFLIAQDLFRERQKATPLTSFSFPSYCVFSNNSYPPNYPLHPNPPPPLPHVTNATRINQAITSYSQKELEYINSHIDCINDQRHPITIDFDVIRRKIERI